MGNQMNGDQSALLHRRSFPLKVNLVKLDSKITTEGLKFEQSPYNIEEEKFVVRPVMDKQIRNSEFCYVTMPQLSEASLGFIKSYFTSLGAQDKQYAQVNKEWRLTRYNVEGHFLEHHDRQKLKDGHRHFGTQIFLPPYSQTRFEGGQLKITISNEVKQILPHQTEWTHLILPLGIEHQVKKVTAGTRISYVKQIWIEQKEEPIQTDQDREIKEAMRFRMRGRGRVD